MLLRGGPGSFFGFAAKEARELHRAVNGLRAAVRKKDAAHAGPCGEFARKRALIGVMKEIREVNGTRGFSPDYFHDARMRMAKGVEDRKSTRLNSSHANISYAVFCLKKKRKLIGCIIALRR